MRFGSRISAQWLAIILILAAFALRTHRLGHKAMWWDEGYSVFLARMPLAEMMDATAHDTHPPIYYAALHFWRMAVGDSEVALRLLSVLAGILLLPLAFRLMRRLAGPQAALCALGLLGLSRVLVWYAQEVRQYSLAACLALASAVLALALWRSGPRWRPAMWLGYVAVNVAGLLTLYLFSSALVAQNLAFALTIWRAPNKWRLMLKWASAQMVIALACLPWLWYYWPRAPHHFVPPTTLTTIEVIKLYAGTLLVGNPSDLDRFWGVMVLGGGLFVVGGWLAWRALRPTPSANFGRWVVLAGTLVPPLLVWLLNLPTGLKLSFVPNPRYFVVLAPWALCLLGLAASQLSKRTLGRVGVSVLLAFWWSYALQYHGERYLTDDFKSAAATLAAYRQPTDVVLLHNDQNWPSVAYHLGGRDWTGFNNGRLIASDADAAQLIETAWQAHTGAWLLLTPEALINDPEHHVQRWLEARALAVREFRGDPAARLFFFARTPERAAQADTLNTASPRPPTLAMSPAPGLTLFHAEWLLPEYRQGDTLRLYLYWQNELAPGEYAYTLRLTTLTGQLVDVLPASITLTDASPARLRQQIDFPVRAYVGPGTYALSIEAGSISETLGHVTVAPAQPHWLITTQPATPHPARFENGIELLGYTARPSAGPLTLTLYWTTTASIDQRYKFFAHVHGLNAALNPLTNTHLWAQVDREPNFGATPVTTWRTGETITESLNFDLPPGVYTVSIGWYDFFTGQRLLVLDPTTGEALADQAVLGPFTLEPIP